MKDCRGSIYNPSSGEGTSPSPAFKDIGNAVEKYLQLGLALIPAIYGTKRPEVEWKKFQENPPSKDQIHKWFSDSNLHNIAILCGPASGNLVVLDFDDPEVYSKFYKCEEIEASTPVVRTGRGGVHVYLRSIKPIPSFRIPELKLEIRSMGNIVIAPPSIHPNGKPYKFINPDLNEILIIKDLEESIWRKAQELGVKAPERLLEEELAGHPGEPYMGEDPPCVTQLMKGVKEGFRNEVAMRIASYYLKFKDMGGIEKVLNLMKSWNQRNKPPLKLDELEAVVKNVAKLDRSYGCRLNQAWCDIQACQLKRRKLLVEEADQEVEMILSQPDVLAALKPHLDNIIAGEDDNKALVFILLLSGKLTDPAMKRLILLKSEAGAGKTTLMKLADSFETKSVGRFTPHALDYTNLEDYEVLRLQEIGNMDEEFQGVSTIKFLSPDDKGYTVEVAERESGKFTTKQYRIPPITLITSTIRVTMDPAFERRSWILSPDESMEQTERIREWKGKQEQEKGFVDLGVMRETWFDRSMAVLKTVTEKLKACRIVLPFPLAMTKVLKSEKLRIRGDFDKVFAEVKLHAFLHQRTLPQAKGKDGVYVVFVTPKSAWKALRLAAKPYATMASDLEERTRNLMSTLCDMGIKVAGDIVDVESREKLAVRLGRSERTIKRYLDKMVAAGYMVKRGGGKLGTPAQHKLLLNLDEIEQKSAGIVDISDATADFIRDIEKEVEIWLNDTLDKISFTDEWPRKRVIEAFRGSLSTHLAGVEKGLSVESVLSSPLSEPISSSVQSEEEVIDSASNMSTMPAVFGGKEVEIGKLASKFEAKAEVEVEKGEFRPVEEKMAWGDLIPILQEKWNTGYEQNFISIAMDVGGLSRDEAKHFFDGLVAEARILRDPDGRWGFVG